MRRYEVEPCVQVGKVVLPASLLLNDCPLRTCVMQTEQPGGLRGRPSDWRTLTIRRVSNAALESKIGHGNRTRRRSDGKAPGRERSACRRDYHWARGRTRGHQRRDKVVGPSHNLSRGAVKGYCPAALGRAKVLTEHRNRFAHDAR